MTCIKKYFLPILFVIATFVLLLIFKSVPISKLWKGFCVLYVPKNTNPEFVFKTLQDNDVTGTISYYNQKVPFTSEFLPLKPDSSDSYLSGRNQYFFDKDHNVMLYYIPDEYSKNATKAVSCLVNEYNLDAGLDSKSSFPLITPIICIICAFIFMILSKNHFVYFLASIFPILFTFSNPFYVNAAAVCIFLYATFLAQKVWNRKGSIKYLSTNPIIIFCLVISLIPPFFISIISGFLYFLCICASAFILFVYKNIQIAKTEKLRFNPIPIIPAHLMNMINIHSIKKFLISICAVAILCVFYVTSVNLFSISNSQDLSFPMPTSYNEQIGIPNMNDYVKWVWNEMTRPYKSLNAVYSQEPVEYETVTIQRFISTNDGIKTNEEVLFCFDGDFKKEVYESIDDLNYPAIEKLMKKQENDFFVNYSFGTGEKFNISNIVILLSMILLPFMIMFFYIIGFRKYDNAN